MKKRKKLKRKFLAYTLTICLTICILGLIYLGYRLMVKKENNISFLETIETTTYAEINKYAIYGIHMNIDGSFTLPEEVENLNLVLSNGQDTIDIDWQLEELENNSYSFKTSDYINEGIVLEDLPIGEYYLLIKTTNHDENNNETIKYYSVQNKTDYSDLEYYTLTKNNKNNKIDIEWNTYQEFPTLRFNIFETKLPDDVYDITIDPGHDAVDSGMTACSDGSTPDYYTGYCSSGTTVKENDLNLEVSLKLKTILEEMGYKVAMTRENKDDEVYIYEKYGSATMANDTKSKFNFAIHHNSSGVTGGVSYLKGLELYVANDINFDFADILVSEITKNANTTTSPKALYSVKDGIYQRFFTEEEIANDDVQPSNKTTNTIYYYNIREVGGISTNATNDGRYYPTYPKNEHYNSNNTAESYLFELGYMDNYQNLLNIMNNSEGYAKGIAEGLKNYLEQE